MPYLVAVSGQVPWLIIKIRGHTSPLMDATPKQDRKKRFGRPEKQVRDLGRRGGVHGDACPLCSFTWPLSQGARDMVDALAHRVCLPFGCW